MNLISLERVAKAYAHQPLLTDVSLGVSSGDRIGIVGRNGAGKTTLLKLLAGTEVPDSGRVTRSNGLRAAYLPQADHLTGPVADIVFGDRSDPSVPWQADPRARSVAGALLTGIPLSADARTLSGGERRRVALASLLVPDLAGGVLLLDEPTNHLDLTAIAWLGAHLRDYGGAVVLVSHDRWLLDTVCDRTWAVDQGAVQSGEGGYSAYVLAEAERARVADASEQRRQNLARKELAWLRRGPQARSTKPRFRVEAANRLIEAEPPARDRVSLARMATARLGKTVLELEDVTVTVPDAGPAAGRVLLDRVTWRLGPGDRIGVVGVNGAGKTSLFRVLDGSSAAFSGRLVRGSTVRLAHLSQDLAELDPGVTVLAAVREVRLRLRVGDRELTASQLLERLGFPAGRQLTRIGDLSGGERRRVQLLRLLMDEPNVLLLDEPTNDLDIETLTELEDLLDGWPGTLVVVSHDRYFTERVTDQIVALLGDGAVTPLPGGIDEYLDRLSGQPAQASPASSSSPAAPSPAALSPSAPPSSALSPAQARLARKELDRLERQIAKLGDQEAELHQRLATHASDYEKLTQLGAELRGVADQKAKLEERWLTVAATLES